DNGKFIAAEPRDKGGLPDAFAQTRGNRLQQGVACRMSERVIDLLETVEIEHEHGEVGSSPARDGKVVLQPLLEQQAIWQIGQRVMLGHMGDLDLRAALLGDVEV